MSKQIVLISRKSVVLIHLAQSKTLFNLYSVAHHFDFEGWIWRTLPLRAVALSLLIILVDASNLGSVSLVVYHLKQFCSAVCYSLKILVRKSFMIILRETGARNCPINLLLIVWLVLSALLFSDKLAKGLLFQNTRLERRGQRLDERTIFGQRNF